MLGLRGWWLPYLAIGCLLLIIPSVATLPVDNSETFLGLTFDERPGEACVSASTVIAQMPATPGFSFCAFVRLARAAQDAAVLKHHLPNGQALEIGMLANGVYLRVTSSRSREPLKRQRKSPDVASMYPRDVYEEPSNIYSHVSSKYKNEATPSTTSTYWTRSLSESLNPEMQAGNDSRSLYMDEVDDSSQSFDSDYFPPITHRNETLLVMVEDGDDNGTEILNYSSGDSFLTTIGSSTTVPAESQRPMNQSHEGTESTYSSEEHEEESGVDANVNDRNETGDSEKIVTSLFTFEAILSPRTWHHLCLLYDTNTKEAKCYVDGTEEPLSHHGINTGANLPDERNGVKFSTCLGSENFNGQLADVQMHYEDIQLNEMKLKYPCRNGSIASANAIVTMSSPWILPGNITLSQLPKSEVCHQDKSIQVIIYQVGGYHKTHQHCKSIGGRLPTFKEIDPSIAETIFTVLENATLEEISWLSSNTTTEKSSYFLCQSLTGSLNAKNISCVKRLKSSICIIKNHRVALYGHHGTHFDHFFHSTVENGELEWKGLQQSVIRRESSNWVVESPFHRTKLYLGNRSLPIGRFEWFPEPTWNSSTTMLTLSLCKTFEFSCSDGTCLPIAQRCDGTYQCEDFTDEANCDVLKLPDSYNEFYEPPPRSGEPVPSTLLYDVEVYHLGTITTGVDKANMDVAVTVSWFDPRLHFANVRVGKKNYFDCKKVWKPSIRTVTGNGDGSVVATNFYEEQCFTMPLKQQPSRNLSDPWMGHSASGSNYPIQYHIGLRTIAPCEFYLKRYPFDRQVCNVSFMVMNAPGTRVFGRSTSGVEVRYLNQKRLLLEYELVNLTTECSTSLQGLDNNSYFLVSYHMERLYGYHIMNSFFPSLLMALVSYSTFYFKINDFYDRILVSLTSHFILASQFIAVTNNSTKTPYLKLLDVWYALIMTFCFTVIIVQVFINALMHCQKFPDWLSERVKLLRYNSNKISAAPIACNAAGPSETSQTSVNVPATEGVGNVTRKSLSLASPRNRRVARKSKLENTIPEGEMSSLSPLDAFSQSRRWAMNDEDEIEPTKCGNDEEVLQCAQERVSVKLKRNSILALPNFASRIPAAKIIAVASLRPEVVQSQAKKNLNKMGPAVASANLANLIAKILLLTSILALLAAYFLVVTNLLD